jgi:hypothetical protein
MPDPRLEPLVLSEDERRTLEMICPELSGQLIYG